MDKTLGKPAALFDQDEKVSNYFIQYPSRLLRLTEKDLDIPRALFHDILRNRLDIIPYKLQVLQHLKDHDYTARFELATWSLQSIQTDASFLCRTIYSD